jgi:DNA-binding transcriptional regulator YiaG
LLDEIRDTLATCACLRQNLPVLRERLEASPRVTGRYATERDPMTPAEFRSIRQLLGLTAGNVANIIDVNERTVRGWEAGARDGKPASVPFAIGLLMRLLKRHAAVRHDLGITLDHENLHCLADAGDRRDPARHGDV